jgi:hypothetical protein
MKFATWLSRIVAFFSIIIFLYSCYPTKGRIISTQEEKLTKVKIIELRPFNSVNLMKSVNESLDTFFLISPRKKEYKIDTAEYVILKLSHVTRFRAGTMEQLGAYLIIGKDTLWKGANITSAPKFYRILEE